MGRPETDLAHRGKGGWILKPKRILAVDDTASARFLLKNHLASWGYDPVVARDGQEALRLMRDHPVDLVISDQVMPGMDGLELLRSVKRRNDAIPVIILTAFGSIGQAVKAIRDGADDYVIKPYAPEALKSAIERSLKYRELWEENRELRAYLDELQGVDNIVFDSGAMARAVDLAIRVARSPETTVAVYGESGTGKELIARAIHSASGCRENRFVGVNCAGIPAGLLEAELFGHVRGAFTGAVADRKGRLEAAQGGTLLLDEIGDMPLDLQAKLLRVLQERRYEKVGGSAPMEMGCRVVVATHRNLSEMVRSNRFRADLFHRINAYPIHVPPLRERPEDIPLLVDHFLRRLRKSLGKAIPGISSEALAHMRAHSWPGNVRELKNRMERAAIVIEGEPIRPIHLGFSEGGERDCELAPDHPFLPACDTEEGVRLALHFAPGEFSLDAAINRILSQILECCDGNKARAAALLGVHRNMFYRRIGGG